MIIDVIEIKRRFSHHPPDAARVKTHERVRRDYAAVALVLADSLPEGREKSLAFTALEESSFWAHAAVARQEKP